jgi:hypothetical protein
MAPTLFFLGLLLERIFDEYPHRQRSMKALSGAGGPIK